MDKYDEDAKCHLNDIDPHTKIMAQRIRDKRLEHGLTMDELGEKVGVKSSAVNKWEHGQVRTIKQSTIQKMADVFNVSPTWLMGYDNQSERIRSAAPRKQIETFDTVVESSGSLSTDKITLTRKLINNNLDLCNDNQLQRVLAYIYGMMGE